jgi:hypothetical protein
MASGQLLGVLHDEITVGMTVGMSIGSTALGIAVGLLLLWAFQKLTESHHSQREASGGGAAGGDTGSADPVSDVSGTDENSDVPFKVTV